MTLDEYTDKIAEVLKAIRATGIRKAEVYDQSFENGDCMIQVEIADWSEMEVRSP
jgi:hypothetical protein